MYVAHGGGFDEVAGEGKMFFESVATYAEGYGGFAGAGQQFSDEIVGFVFDGDVGNACEDVAGKDAGLGGGAVWDDVKDSGVGALED